MTPKAARLTFALASRFEGLRLRPYLCPANVWTIGRGATYYKDGSRVQPADPAITVEQADDLLLWGIVGVYLPAALRLCPTADTFARLAALSDFALNLGPTRLKQSTLRRRVLAGDWEGAASEVLKWDRCGARRLLGLTRRCQARAALMSV